MAEPEVNKTRLSVIGNEIVVQRARSLLLEGLSTLALDALINDLASAAGADDPEKYILSSPYTKQEIDKAPYLRLRVGFGYGELLEFFQKHFDAKFGDPRPIEHILSTLIDAFIDRGAIVPTFTLRGDKCARIYRKGEASPRWDEEVNRLLYTLGALGDDRDYLLDRGRTRVAKISAILAFSGVVPTSLQVSPLERGNAATLPTSVVEKQAAELTGLVRRRGLWDKQKK